MAEASRWFVNLDELMEAAGRRIAELTGAEWGIVTCGSAAAVALGTAACVAGNDPVKMLRLPFTDGMVNRVIIPRSQRFAYDQAVRMIGCRIIEIETREDLDHALTEPVAMVVLLGKQEHLTAGAARGDRRGRQAARHSDHGRCRFRAHRTAEPVAGARRRSRHLQRRQVPARPADQRSAARRQSPWSRRLGATPRRTRRWAGR